MPTPSPMETSGRHKTSSDHHVVGLGVARMVVASPVADVAGAVCRVRQRI